MQIVFSLVAGTASALLGTVLLAMFLRALFSFLPGSEDWFISDFLYYVTEPAVLPIRLLFSYFGWFEDSPVDVCFFIAYLAVSFLRISLPTVL